MDKITLNQFNQAELLTHLEGIPRQDRIAALRAFRGLSQGALGDKVGVSRATVAAWETTANYGQRPGKRNRVKLAILFGVPAKVFTDEWGARQPTKAEIRAAEAEERRLREEEVARRREANLPRNLRTGPNNPAQAERRGTTDGSGRREPPPGVKRIG